MSVKRLLIFAVAVIALLVFAYRNIIPGQFALVDIIPWSKFASQYYFANFLSSWGKTALGTAQAAPPSFIFLAIFTYLFKNNIGLGHQIFYLSLLPLSGITMYIFLNEFIDSEIAKYVGALFYAINPLSMGQFAGGAGYIIVYPVLPLLAFWFCRLLREGKERRLRNTLMFSLFLTLGAAFNSFLPLVIMPILGAYLLVWGLKNRNVKDIANILLFTALSFVIVILLMLPNYYALIFSSLKKPLSQIAAEGAGETSIQSFIPQIRWTYSQATPINLLRMLHGIWYGSSTLWNLFSLLIPILAFIPLVWFERKKSLFVLGSGVLIVTVILFISLTRQELTTRLFELIPAFFIYRNPVPLVMLLPLAYGSLIAITVNQIHGGFTTGRKGKYFRAIAILDSPTARLVAISLIAAVIAIYSWPFFTGDLGLSRSIGKNYVVPKVYYKMTDWIEKNKPKTPFRVVILPWDYNTKLRSTIIDMIPDVAVLPVPKNVLGTLSTGQGDDVATMLGSMNVKYIIVNLDSNEKHKGFYSKVLDQQKDLKKVWTGDQFVVYENKKFLPEIAFSDHLYLTITTGESSEQITRVLDYLTITTGESSEQIMQLLARAPGFDLSKVFLMQEKNVLSEKNSWLKRSDLVIIPSNAFAYVERLSTYDGNLLLFYTDVNLQIRNSYSLYVPRSGRYKVAIRGSSEGNIAVAINNKNVNISEIEDRNEEVSWYESDPVLLDSSSSYNLLVNPGKGVIVDEVALFSSSDSHMLLSDLFKKAQGKSGLAWRKISPTQYEANITSDAPLFVMFGQDFDPRWEASINGKAAQHFTSYGWGNGFYVDAKGQKILKISYKEQGTRNIVLGIWMFSWLLLAGGIVYTHRFLLLRN